MHLETIEKETGGRALNASLARVVVFLLRLWHPSEEFLARRFGFQRKKEEETDVDGISADRTAGSMNKDTDTTSKYHTTDKSEETSDEETVRDDIISRETYQLYLTF